MSNIRILTWYVSETNAHALDACGDREVILNAMEELLAKLKMSGQGGETQPLPPKVLEDLTLVGVVKHIQQLQESDNSRSQPVGT